MSHSFLLPINGDSKSGRSSIALLYLDVKLRILQLFLSYATIISGNNVTAKDGSLNEQA